MIVMICSDIHANIAALDAVYAHAQSQSFDRVWCLGDIIGYGPSPGLCIERLTSLLSPECWLMGNHDAFALDIYRRTSFLVDADRDAFTPDAHTTLMALPTLCAADHTVGGFPLDRLLDTLAQTAITTTPTPDCILAHGSMRDPLTRYGTGDRGCNAFAASDEFAQLATSGQRCLIVGHSHYPCLFVDDPTQPLRAQPQALRAARWMPLPDQQCVIINPGSVGQPRDNNPQASYALLDLERWRVKFLRVPYSATETARLIRQRGLPETLAARLQQGE